MHPIYTNYRADFVETARGCVSSAFSPTASAKLGSECAVPAWARPPRTAVGRNCPRFDCGFRVGAALVAARPSDRAAGGARSNQALPKRFSSCWRVSSMATGRPWGQYLLPGGPVHRGPREDFTSSGQVNCPCGKVSPEAKTLGRAKGAKRGQIRLCRSVFPVAGGSAQWPLAARGDSI